MPYRQRRRLRSPITMILNQVNMPQLLNLQVVLRRKWLDPTAWTRLTVRDGEKGPVAVEMVRRRVQTRIERKRPGPEEWLVVTRRPLADDRTFEPRASRDATDQDAQHRYQYYLTPTAGSTLAFKEPSLA